MVVDVRASRLPTAECSLDFFFLKIYLYNSESEKS